jgi:hypothetical protein
VTQNSQIQGMRMILEQNNFPPDADCMVPIALSDSAMDNTTDKGNSTSNKSSSGSMFVSNMVWIGSIVLLFSAAIGI